MSAGNDDKAQLKTTFKKINESFTHDKQVSYIRLPISCWTWLIVSRSCLVTAWPLNDSTLKLFVFAGKIKNATTVTSGSELWKLTN